MDVSELIGKARRHNKANKSYDSVDIRIAVLGSYSIQYYVSTLRYYLFIQGICADIYEGDYNGINMDVYNSESAFFAFKPDVVLILSYCDDVNVFPELFACDKDVDALIKAQMNYYKGIWTKISANLDCHILQSNLVIPPIKQLGNLECKYSFSRNRFYQRLNQVMVEEAAPNVTIMDLEELAAEVGKRNWFDYPSYYLTKTGFNIHFLPEVVDMTARLIQALKGKTKKCLVLDLDNTIWGGIVGDDGWEGIQLDPNHAVGEAYRAFQRYILQLKERGVILAICSKNDIATAKEPFEKNENMLIKLDDIACFVANWEDKASNLERIAQELNIGIDSLVFFDDNPVEREIVRNYVPQVMVIDVPVDPALYALALSIADPFEWMQLTKEDVTRSSSYIQNNNRDSLMTSFVNYNEYLQVLEMRGQTSLLDHDSVTRFAQLINKSNQFNLRTQRYTEAEIRGFMEDNNMKCVYVKLKDKFSDYGIISCVILKMTGEECFIDTWVMSCRVLKRGVEYLMFKKVLELVRNNGCKVVKSEYLETKKNTMVSDFYDKLGFEKTLDEMGRSAYCLNDLDTLIEFFIWEEE